MRAFRIASFFLWLCAGTFLIAGISTEFWSETKGTVISFQEKGFMAGGYRTRFASEGGVVVIQRAYYQYLYEGQSYLGGQICFCMPIAAVAPLTTGTQLSVYVFPWYPRLSVLKQGPDLVLVLLFGIVGWASWQYSRMIYIFFERAAKARRRRIR